MAILCEDCGYSFKIKDLPAHPCGDLQKVRADQAKKEAAFNQMLADKDAALNKMMAEMALKDKEIANPSAIIASSKQEEEEKVAEEPIQRPSEAQKKFTKEMDAVFARLPTTDHFFENKKSLATWKSLPRMTVADLLQHGAVIDYQIPIITKTRTLQDGTKYTSIGQRPGPEKLPTGVCRTVFSSGEIFEGMYEDGKQHGEGKYVFADGAHYTGMYEDGKQHGEGRKVYADGGHYTGMWEDGKRHGQGRKVYANEDHYTGMFKDDKQHGQGRAVWPDGAHYTGMWKDGKQHGQGRFVWPDGRVKEGKWEKNEFLGNK